MRKRHPNQPAPQIKLHDYLSLLQQHPEKYNGPEVGFLPRTDQLDERCGRCWHYYRNAASIRGVCEIYRPETETDSGVPSNGVCAFFTTDGLHYPRLPATALERPNPDPDPEPTEPEEGVSEGVSEEGETESGPEPAEVA